jgi:hypothetical protein
MSWVTRVLLAVSILLIAIATATCIYGTEYDQRLAEQAAASEGYILFHHGEPAGDRWIMIGTLILCVGMGIGLGAVRRWIQEKKS